MKKITAVFAFMFFALHGVFSQKQTPLVNYKGHIIHQNKQIGTITTKGGNNLEGKPITMINSNGNIVDTNGKVLGKAPKNGTFIYYFDKNSEKYSVGKPNHNGICEVKNSNGETVLLLHNNYKKQAACAIHCLYENHCIPNNSEHKH